MPPEVAGAEEEVVVVAVVQEEAVAPAVEVQPAEVCQEAQPVSAEQEAWVPRAVRPRGPVRRRDRLTRVQPVRDLRQSTVFQMARPISGA